MYTDANDYKKDIQVFITSTDINDIDNKILKGAVVYRISDGNIDTD